MCLITLWLNGRNLFDNTLNNLVSFSVFHAKSIDQHDIIISILLKLILQCLCKIIIVKQVCFFFVNEYLR